MFGDFIISSGEVISGEIFESSDYDFFTLTVESGGAVIDNTFAVQANMYVSGEFNSNTVNDYSWIEVQGTASGNILNSGGLGVSSGGTANGNILNDGSLNIYSGGTASGNTVNSSGRFYVSSGGTADNTVIHSGGSLSLYGGTVNGTTVNSGEMYVYDDGTANETTVNFGGSMSVHEGTATGTIVNSGGQQTVSEGLASHTVVSSGGRQIVRSDGIGRDTVVRDGGMLLVDDFGRVEDITVSSGGRAYVQTLSEAKDVDILTGGTMFVGMGGYAEDITVQGTLHAAAGAELKNAAVSGTGAIYLYGGAVLDGVINVRGTVILDDIVHNNGRLNFMVGGPDSGSAMAMLNDYSLLNGKDMSVTVDTSAGDQGSYALAGGAAGYNESLTVYNPDGGELCTLSAGTSCQNGNYNYALTLDDGTLIFSYSDGGVIKLPEVLSVDADITALTNQDVTVTATFSEDTVTREYRLENADWQAYASGVVMEDNGTVYFRAGNDYGYSEAASYTVTNIDKVPPAAPAAAADITAPTNQNVTVTATFSEDSVRKQYSLDNANWNDYTTGIVMNDNGTVYFRAIDAAGNISDSAYTVGNIITHYDVDSHDPDTVVTDKGKTVVLTTPVAVADSGRYVLTGNFAEDVSGSVTVFNNGKKAGTGSIKNGELIFNKGNPFLLTGSVPTELQITVKSGDIENYSVKLEARQTFPSFDPAGSSPETALWTGEIAGPGAPVANGWVGYGDEVDYFAFSLNHATNLILDLTTTDAAKFTVYDAAGKSVMTSSVKGTGLAALTTKPKLVNAGLYYLAVQSTNAKKGGSADFTVSVDPETVFFTKGYNGDDTPETAGPLGVIATPAELVNDWVGVGDEFDYRSFSLATGAKLSFTVGSSDAVKFSVYDASTGKAVLKNFSVKAGEISDTKDLLVTAGNYYFSVQSSNAKKGGNADYSVQLNGKSRFFPAADNGNDTWQDASVRQAKFPGEEITGWVGYGDARDFIKFQLAGNGQIQLDLNGTTADAYNAKQIKLTCLDANGKSVALGALDGDTLVSKKPVDEGEYYLGVTCANVKKFDTSYSVTTGLLALRS